MADMDSATMATPSNNKEPQHATDAIVSSSERRGSLVLNTRLAGEEDAAVLAKMGCVNLSLFLLALKADPAKGTSKSFVGTSV